MDGVFSLQEYWMKIAEEHVPEMSFRKGDDFESWKRAAYEKFIELLGIFPEKVPLCPETLSVEDKGEYILKKVNLKADRFMIIPAYVLIPKCASAQKRVPAIVCSHGHGKFGKDPVSGLRSDPEMEHDLESQNYNYAEQMARRGYVTIAPDLRGFGERKDLFDPVDIPRDPCNVNYVKGSILGIYPLTLNVFDMSRCIDYLESLDFVDPERIGMMGLSQGGTMTTFTTAFDRRIKACDIIGYVNPFADFGIRDGNFCGSQVLPGIYRYFDTYDIAGLIAPRPCLLEMGRADECFPFEYLMRGYEGLKKIYEAAGVPERLHADIHDGKHAFSGRLAFDFFDRYL